MINFAPLKPFLCPLHGFFQGFTKGRDHICDWSKKPCSDWCHWRFGRRKLEIANKKWKQTWPFHLVVGGQLIWKGHLTNSKKVTKNCQASRICFWQNQTIIYPQYFLPHRDKSDDFAAAIDISLCGSRSRFSFTTGWSRKGFPSKRRCGKPRS